jgi:hypothetical protein
MIRRITLLLVLVAGCWLAAVPAMAKEKKEKAVPDLVGVWKGSSESVAMGRLDHADAASAPTFLRIDWTLTIEKQEGRTFYGTRASARGKETVVGVVDGGQIFMADDDGTFAGKLTSKNRLVLRYVEAGKQSKVASISLFVREGEDDAPPPAAPAQ